MAQAVKRAGLQEAERTPRASCAHAQTLNEAYAAYRRDPGGARLDALLARGEPLVRHFAARLCGHGEPLYEDVLQCGRMGLFRAARSYEESNAGNASFLTWASCCMLGEMRHYLRRERAYSAACPDTGGAVPPSGGGGCEPDERLALLQAMRELPGAQRTVIQGVFFSGMTQQELAQRLHVSQRKVSRLKEKALALLRNELEAPNFRLAAPARSFRRVK